MKFILAEDKFILNESAGFILEERFSLDEDILLEAQATLKQLVIDLNKLDTLLPELLAALPTGLSLKILDGTPLEGEKLDVEEQIKTGCTEIQDLLKDKKNFKELIDKIRAKAILPEGSFTEDEVKVLQPLCYSIASDGTSVKDRLKGIKSHKGEIAEQAATLQERLPKLKNSIEELYKFFENTDSDTTEEPDEKIKYSLDPTTLELKPGETSKVTLMATPKPESPVSATFVTTNDKVATVTETGEVTAVAVGEAQIKVTVAEQTLICTLTVSAADSEEEPAEEDPETPVETDWADLYRLCGNSENKEEAFKCFWKGGLPTASDEAKKRRVPQAATEEIAMGYFKGEWGERAQLVESFGTAFTDTLKELGWNATLNPFIEWLRKLFRVTDLTFSGDSFETVLEAYNNRELSENDLRGNGALGALNLVLNPLLYTKASDEILEYLTWQQKAINAESKVPSDSTLKTVYANIVYADMDPKKEDVKTSTTGIKGCEAANFKYKIRPLTAYKSLIKVYLNDDTEKSKAVQATDDDIEAIAKKITSSATAKKFLAYIVNYYRVAKLSALETLFKEPFGDKLKANRDSTETTFDEDKAFDKLLQTATKRYSVGQLITLVTKLIATAGL